MAQASREADEVLRRILEGSGGVTLSQGPGEQDDDALLASLGITYLLSPPHTSSHLGHVAPSLTPPPPQPHPDCSESRPIAP